MIDFAALFSSTSAAINIAKAVREMQGEYDKADLKLKMAELTSTLADVKMALVEVRDELAEKDAEILRLKEAFTFKGQTAELHGWTFPALPGGQPYGKPFCPKCIEADGRFILTQQYGGMIQIFCPRCTTKYPHADTLLEKEQMIAHLEQHAAKPSDGGTS